MNFNRDSSNLDALRSFAVLLVIYDHLMVHFGIRESIMLSPRLLGLFGVFLFFVHTSFVLMYSLERQQQRQPGQALFWPFILRRCFRIYPLSVVAVTAYFLLIDFTPHHLFGWPTVTSSLGDHVSMPVFVSNLLLIQDLTGASSPGGVPWTLPLEMHMYLFLPLLFLLSHRVGTKGLMLGLWPVAVVVALVQLKIHVGLEVLKHVPLFVPGVVCYSLSKTRPVLGAWALPVVLAASLTAYLLLCRVIPSQVAAGYPICLFVGLALPRITEVSNQAVRRAAHLIAKYSYGIYLAHPICIMLAFVWLRPLPAPAQWFAFLAFLCSLPFALYHGVEAPMIAAGNWLVTHLFSRQQIKPRRVLRSETHRRPGNGPPA